MNFNFEVCAPKSIPMETKQIACLLVAAQASILRKKRCGLSERRALKQFEKTPLLQPHFTSVSFNLHQAKEIKLLAVEKLLRMYVRDDEQDKS